MAGIVWKRLIGQERIKEVFSSAFDNGTLGHAYLLCGEKGAGTFTAAVELAMALLCSAEGGKPCYQCDNCRRVLSYSHPDMQVVMPLSLQKEHKSSDGKLSEEGWQVLAERVKERIADPYAVPEFATLPGMPVEWVREVAHAIKRGAVESGRQITIIDGIDAMQQEAANAMLKTIEEPPPGALLLLCTDRLHAVLPTIISRCQILRLSFLSPDLIRAELMQQFGVPESDPRLATAIYSGSLGQARYLFENVSTEVSRDALEFWEAIIAQEWEKITAVIDRLSGTDDFSNFEKLFVQLLQLIRNAFLTKIEGTENYIMGDGSACGALEKFTTPREVDRLVQCCEEAIGRLRARANVTLVLINFALSIMEYYYGEK